MRSLGLLRVGCLIVLLSCLVVTASSLSLWSSGAEIGKDQDGAFVAEKESTAADEKLASKHLESFRLKKKQQELFEDKSLKHKVEKEESEKRKEIKEKQKAKEMEQEELRMREKQKLRMEAKYGKLELKNFDKRKEMKSEKEEEERLRLNEKELVNKKQEKHAIAKKHITEKQHEQLLYKKIKEQKQLETKLRDKRSLLGGVTGLKHALPSMKRSGRSPQRELESKAAHLKAKRAAVFTKAALKHSEEDLDQWEKRKSILAGGIPDVDYNEVDVTSVPDAPVSFDSNAVDGPVNEEDVPVNEEDVPVNEEDGDLNEYAVLPDVDNSLNELTETPANNEAEIVATAETPASEVADASDEPAEVVETEVDEKPEVVEEMVASDANGNDEESETPEIVEVVTLPPEVPEAVEVVTLPPEVPEVVEVVTLPPEVSEVVEVVTLPPEVPEVVEVVTLPPEVPEVVTLPPEVPEVVEVVTLPPEVLEVVTLPPEVASIPYEENEVSEIIEEPEVSEVIEVVTLGPEFTDGPEVFRTTEASTVTEPAEINTIPLESTTVPEVEVTDTTAETTIAEGSSWPWQIYSDGEESCGQPRFGEQRRPILSVTAKILQGKEALPGSFPWQVAILDSDRDLLCGGTLIAPRWVMTAAHCIRKKLFVRLWEHHIHEKDGFEVEQKVLRIFKHPEYNSSIINNDIALLRLPALPEYLNNQTGEVTSGVVDRACLPNTPQEFPSVGTRCTVMGWGKASMSHRFGTDVLMYTRLPIISRKACQRANSRHAITENMFCAGHYKGGADTCSGDSGGPLLCTDGSKSATEVWTVHGITSFGNGCGVAGQMGVYTKVNNYLGWMAEIMNRYI